MRLQRAGLSVLAPDIFGIPLVPEIPRQWRQRTEPGVTVVTNVFDISGEPGADAPRPDGASAPVPTGHEQVVFCQDAPTGLRAIIAIYSTALGPGLGGTRCYPYASEGEALADVLR